MYPRSCCTGAATAPCRSVAAASSRLLPNARFVPLAGDSHLPWRDDRRELMRALAGFLHSEAAPEQDGSPPTRRASPEVLRLVATGMSNREIAGTLVLSEHTVHRHVANILNKPRSARVRLRPHMQPEPG